MWRVSMFALVCSLVSLGASAGDFGSDWLGDGFVRLDDGELERERGGLRQASFAIHFEGLVNGTPGEGVITLLDPAAPVSPASIEPFADAFGFIGELGPFQGIGQFAIVNGDGNDVVNNLTVNIFMTDSAGGVTTFSDVLSAINP